jgi:uncharacterized membrane protein
MYKNRKQLKKSALNALSGKWGLAISMSLVMFFVSVSFSYNTTNPFNMTVMPIVISVLNVLLNVGFYSFLLKLLCGQKERTIFYDLFYGFKCYPGKAILLYLLTSLYMLPGTLIYVIGIFIFTFVIYASAGVSMDLMLTGTVPPDMTLMLAVLIVVIILTLLFAVYAAFISSTYALVYFLLLDYPELSATEIWRKSAQLMKGNRLRYIGLILSFIPWFLLSLLTFGFGTLWLNPYISAAQAAFYLDLVQNQPAKKQPTTNWTPTPLPSDLNLTHDCETSHPETSTKNNNDYSGIDQNTFK